MRPYNGDNPAGTLARLDQIKASAQNVADWCDSAGGGRPIDLVGPSFRPSDIALSRWPRFAIDKFLHFFAQVHDRPGELGHLRLKRLVFRVSSHISPRLARLRATLPRPWR